VPWGCPGAALVIQFLDTINGGAIGSMSATATSAVLENSSLNAPQRVFFHFQVDFADGSAFTAEMRDIYVQASFAGLQDIALMHLIEQPNPFMADAAISWLSTDLRVFQLRPNDKVNTFSNVILKNPDTNPNAPYNYIQALLSELRRHGNNPASAFEISRRTSRRASSSFRGQSVASGC